MVCKDRSGWVGERIVFMRKKKKTTKWRNHGIEDATWEVKKEYLELFVNQGEKFRGRNSFKEERV